MVTRVTIYVLLRSKRLLICYPLTKRTEWLNKNDGTTDLNLESAIAGQNQIIKSCILSGLLK